MPSILYAMFFLVAGGATAWVIRKLLFEKGHIPAAELHRLKEELQDWKTRKAVLEQAHTCLKEEKDRLAQLAEKKYLEAQELKAALVGNDSYCNNLEANCATANARIQEMENELQQKNKELYELAQLNFGLNARVQAGQEKLDTQKAELENLGKKFQDSFQVLAQTILEDKTKRFSETQDACLKNILEPLQKEIIQFKQQIETKHQQESDERISLREQVRNMTALNQTLSQQANKLTETLRLQVKQQGDWGESILEAILENSGLQKDLQYFTQQSAKNDDGKTIRPDVLIKYPDARTVIIDSKVSLVRYYHMCSEGEEAAQQRCLKGLIQSIKTHIDGLAAKDYQHITQAQDFIVMFVPVEPAYIAAMHGDPGLWQYAYKKGIFLISPANLIATLKLVKDLWRKDAVDKNAQETADRAGKLYDKLVTFIEAFERVGDQLEKAGETWDEARKLLTAGKGNLISQALKMQALHIHSKKELPADLSNAAILTDHFAIDENGTNNLKLFE